MGMGHSLHNQRDYEPPPLPSPFGPGGPFQGFPRTSRASQASSHSSLASTLQNQEPRAHSLRSDEWWHQPPPPPTMNLRQPHEALLTYATQMTGFQSEYASGVPSVHQEAMELTRTVSHLAAANQQLASAHSAVLNQLEALYLDLNKAREEKSGKKCDCDLRRRVEIIERVVGQCQCSGRKVDDDWRSVKKKGRGEDGEYIRREYQRAVERIRVLESELKSEGEDERTGGLVRDVKRLKEEQGEMREINRRLRNELERVRRDYEISKNNFKSAQETSQAVREVDELRGENTGRVMDPENKLHKENSIPTDEVEDRKQREELEESLKEIQRLNEIIVTLKSVKNSDAETSTPEEPVEPEESQERPNLEDFKKDLCLKREARQRAIAAVSSEMDRLRRELDAEKEAHSETSKVLDLLKTQSENASRKTETFSIGTTTVSPSSNSLQKDAQRLTDVLKVSDELRGCIRLQIEKIDDLRYHLECDVESNHQRIETLKEIAKSDRESFETREHQMNRLKNILSQIVARLGDEKFSIEISEDLRTEHDRQVEDIRRLKSLYDERMRVLVELKDSAVKEGSSTRQKLKCLMKEKESLDEDLKRAEEKIDVQDTEVSNLESQLGLTKADCRDLQNQMSLINSLFSQMLLSASSADMDLDRLTQLLQENHDLISDMAREEGTEAAALPKLLLDLVEQVEGREKSKSIEGNSDEAQEESIANNLPKVWKVLTELLSCQAAGSSASTSSTLLSNDPNSCYKSVDTPTGPRLVISVSKTYIRLKELILEKKHLEKEMGRMKQLNSHLESKLGEQEKRLSTVSDELSKTWNVVGRMQAQHQQLHTHEKILRYELQQKRKMLQELKQELEYCREKWESARQKNTNTEIEWKNLRREFAARKALAHDSFNNSAESGFSDDRCDDSDDEEGEAEERVRTGPRRRTRKESPRAPTPDTESEQPTDTEISDPKTESTSPEQRTPTPETSDGSSTESSKEPQNLLDQALANVIQNLIHVDDNQSTTPSPTPSNPSDALNPEEDKSKNSGNQEPQNHQHEETIENHLFTSTHQHSVPEDIDKTHEDSKKTSNLVSVFSIGPFPAGKTVQFSDPLVVGPSNDLQDSLFGSSDGPIPSESTSTPTEVTVEALTSVNREMSKTAVQGAEDDVKEDLEGKVEENSCDPPSTSSSRSSRTPEEVLAARDARLKRLEEQAEWLMKKMNATSRRGSALSTRLEELHEAYGEPPAPPPMPDVLPSVRIPTNPDVTQEAEATELTTESTDTSESTS